MTSTHLLSSVSEAPWLPTGSSAETWVGSSCRVAAPVIAARLLITREATAGGLEFFCVPSPRGLNIPTRYLWADHGKEPYAKGRAQLLFSVFGRQELATRCIGFIRNVVPAPDQSYDFPLPWAHVPVLLVTSQVAPHLDGEWHNAVSGRVTMSHQHWWPIVEHFLTPPLPQP